MSLLMQLSCTARFMSAVAGAGAGAGAEADVLLYPASVLLWLLGYIARRHWLHFVTERQAIHPAGCH